MDQETKKKIDDIINGQPYFTNMAVYDPLQYQFNYGTSLPITNAGPVGAAPNVTIASGGTASAWSSSMSSYTSSSSGNLQVRGDAEIEGDIKWQGRSLTEMFNNIERRLAILVPDPNKLEQFEALKKAYNHYKVLEALCELPKNNNEDK
jgi:hypothetical protein